MKTRLLIPHVVGVEVPRPHVVRVTFDDGLVKEWEFMPGSHEGTVFEPFDDPAFFRRARVDPESRTVAGPNGVDLDPVVLHGDLAPANGGHFRDVRT
jgi:hypothetical protein